MADLVTLRSDALTVTVSTRGAELQSVTDADGRDWLWDGDPRWWTGRAPILFPTVGVTADGARFGDRRTALGKHGFARDSDFTATDADEAHASFRLEASDATRAVYPFAFRLDVTHRLDGATLTIAAEVSNQGEEPMPVGFGFHPALRWPLPGTGAASRFDHIVRFDADEPGALRAISADGLIAAAPRPTPVHDNELHLRDALFEHDALVWDRPASRSLCFGVADEPGVRVDFADMPMLGIWTKPGAGYLCIEPWHSHADEEGFAGQFADKPGVATLAPGEAKSYAMSLTFGVPLI
ncbi:aldose 1-epimerase family protein [Sphingomonas sp.]|uniref:aldose 1-epimerase family protein n=1 Tax=Sphingomonas sp. TaxID=28214 RepID=UPI003B003CC2